MKYTCVRYLLIHREKFSRSFREYRVQFPRCSGSILTGEKLTDLEKLSSPVLGALNARSPRIKAE